MPHSASPTEINPQLCCLRDGCHDCAQAWLDLVDAASVSVIAVTAWQALFEQATAVRGQRRRSTEQQAMLGAFTVQLAWASGWYPLPYRTKPLAWQAITDVKTSCKKWFQTKPRASVQAVDLTKR
jgi:hypothetical protein